MTGKGTGQGGCCCGSCMSPPGDTRIGAGSYENVRPVQQYCCRCIPKTICVAVTQAGVTQTKVVPRYCLDTTYIGDPIQYRTSAEIDGVLRTINIRLIVSGDPKQCYIGWDVVDRSLSGTILIDPEVPATTCNHNLEPKVCSEFGGTWTVVATVDNELNSDLTIIIGEPPTVEIANVFECAGCNCICKCMCISVWSQIENLITIIGSNEIACATTEYLDLAGCGVAAFRQISWLRWVSNGWTITLGERSEWPPYTRTINSGTETITGTCAFADAVWFGSDVNKHTITGTNAQIIYDWELDYRVAKSFKWVGLTRDENATLTFDAWNWITSAWVTITTSEGRPATTSIPRAVAPKLTAAYTGTGADKGKVRIRLTTDGSVIITDMLRVVTSECCALTLTPPEGVTPTTPLARIELTGTNACPDPKPFWTFTDTTGTIWSVAAECSWCDGKCGSGITECCARPLPRFLFAEVMLDCVNCPGAFVIPLDSGGSGSGPWSGSVTWCGMTIDLSFACGGSGWEISGNVGSCTYSASPAPGSCDPLNVAFSALTSGGLGCCGPAGDPFAVPTISGTIIE